MNRIDITIEKILTQPKQVITDELCCWEVEVECNCYGAIYRKIFRATSKKEIEKYKPGFTWME